ncbi:glycoside hydrolase family 2 TIM barrel-domain containing protein [Alteromonas sp. AMM-1]|uniref:glycoside hydrolase family 2 TIM barrel-domain containing protein n=1 Tax=Alteromonas sp. AMM-1 TaxID=3394233 RepID=UPI0039A6A2CC
MRERIKATLCLAIIALFGCSTENHLVSGSVSNHSVRNEVALDQPWRFQFSADLPADIYAPGFDASQWQQVSVPHSWNRVGYYLDSASPHIHTQQNINVEQGVGIYRTAFSLDAANQGKHHWLEFDAVSRVAEVWLNGQYLGEHRGSFNRFRLNATDAVTYNAPNILVVRVDNSKPTAESNTADTLPIAGDFFVHGGIYRPVRLISTNDVHIDMQDFGGAGVYATTVSANDKAARIDVNSRVTSHSLSESAVEVEVNLLNASGELTATTSQVITVSNSNTAELNQVLDVQQPRLWQGTDDPYLYQLEVVIKEPNGTVLDKVRQDFGIRTIAITAEDGVLLNGKPLHLQGVAYHQDREGRGWAVSEQDVEDDVAIMAQMGANTIRLAHYPHGQPVHNIANRLGLLLWDEIPLVSAWRYGEQHEEVNKAIADNASLQLIEMVKQNFNHPSVAVWGIANEVDFGAVVPMFVQSAPGSNPDPVPLLKRLASEVELLDASRPSTLANCCANVATWQRANVPDTSAITQTTGANRYFGWYYGNANDLGPHLDDLHKQYPGQPYAVTEYGAGGAPTFHTDNVLGGPVAATGRNQPEEYMTYVHEVNWQAISQRPYLWASWIWNAFDFATTTRREGDSQDINTKGLVTYDRAIKKDAYFFYQANWTDTPMVHITSRRYKDRAYQVADIKVFSNAPLVELNLNGKSVGQRSECTHRTCIWESIRLAEGENSVTAVGLDIDGKELVSDSIIWQLNTSQHNAYFIDAGAQIAATTQNNYFGSDNFFTGGQAASYDKPGGWGRPPVLADIHGTEDRDLFATYRKGEFGYRLPLDNGSYRVAIYYVVNNNEAPVDFNVVANDELVLANLGADDAANDGLNAHVREATVIVKEGLMAIDFVALTGEPNVSAIAITPF